jgi:hypothetical protein
MRGVNKKEQYDSHWMDFNFFFFHFDLRYDAAMALQVQNLYDISV